jgi:hypothetical protein
MYKYKMRPSPSKSATTLSPGKVLEGNDYWKYEVVQDKTGTHRWQLVPEAAQRRKEWDKTKTTVSFVLKPYVTKYDIANDREGPCVSGSDTQYMKRNRIPAFSSPKLMQIVWNSLPIPLYRPQKFYAKNVKWNAARKWYDVVFVLASPEDAVRFAREDLPRNYGPLAADTWMEGDTSVTPVDYEKDTEYHALDHFDVRDVKVAAAKKQ